MKDTIITTILVGFAFVLSLGLLYSYVVLYNSGDLIKYNIKEEQIHGDSIFLLGSSYVNVIDRQFVKNYLSAYDTFVNVYHPADALPSNTLLIIDDIIKNNPQVVVMGVGFRDIGLGDGICNVIDDISESTKKSIKKESKIIESDTNPIFTSNPKHITVELLRHYLEGNKEKHLLTEDNVQISIPLMDGGPTNIIDIEILNGNRVPSHGCLDSQKKNTELDDLRTIIQKLKENNIRVILFVPPFTKAYLQSIPTHIEVHLIGLLRQVAIEHSVEFYDLSHKYETSNIFSDSEHVAHHSDSTVYSKDIAQIILKQTHSPIMRHIDVSSIEITKNTDLSFVDLAYANLSKIDLSNVNLKFSNLENANLTNTNLSNSNLQYINLKYANLHNVILTRANLVGADLSGAKLVGVDLTNMDLSGAKLVGADLSDSNLVGADLSRANFSFAVLTNSNLSHTILTQGNFVNAQLENTNITNVVAFGTIMNNVTFTNADLSFSNFQGSFLLMQPLKMQNLLTLNSLEHISLV